MFYFDDFYGSKILKSTLIEGGNCFFTTRDFVLTPGALAELKDTAERNREFLKEKLGCKDLVTAEQVHKDNIEIIEKSRTFYEKTDALISNLPGKLILLNYADCTPVILYSKKDNTAAVIHAGWRGTALNISAKTVLKMQKELNIKPQNITALIGPCIGSCCFETDKDVFDKLIEDKTQTDLYMKKGSKYYIDLKLLNYKQLKTAGVQNIDISSYCTSCMSDIFFSYRKEKGKTARHSAIAAVKHL